MDDVKRHWQRGTAASSAGDAAGAAACFRAALGALPATRANTTPRCALLCNLSAAALAAGDAAGAVQAARGAVAECRADKGCADGTGCLPTAKPLYRLGVALAARGAHAAAVAALTAALAAAAAEGDDGGPVRAELDKARAKVEATRRRAAPRPPPSQKQAPVRPPPSEAIVAAATTLGLALDQATDRRCLRRAYLRAAAAAHPDRGGSDAAFRGVRAAYDVLRAARRAGGGVAGESAAAVATTTPTLPPPAETEAEFRARHAAAAAAAEAEAAAIVATNPRRAVELLTEAARAARAAGGGAVLERVVKARAGVVCV